ncbi:MAG: biotin--[acetyl-CoA-carboxylase] ligase [Actinobacteria bacterium]|nr:biotin--[acetyl-CoA-carboxylase] ligase [Actinomycetota bacterium]
MQLPLTSEALPEIIWLDSAESTNTALRELVSERAALGVSVPHGTLVVTPNQTAGRGRQGRGWETPPDTALASSLLLRPGGGLGEGALGMSWIPLLAGSAITRALQPLFSGDGGIGDDGSSNIDDEDRQPLRVGVKWPNDVHVRDEEDAMAGRPGAKLCGILCEVLPGGEVIVGFGINLLLQDWQLPTERAGSVLACGGETYGAETLADPLGAALADRVLSVATRELLDIIALAASNPQAARNRVLRDSLTLGAEVRVHMPGGEMIDGRAVGLDADGALIVDRPTTGQLIVNAADVEHLRARG